MHSYHQMPPVGRSHVAQVLIEVCEPIPEYIIREGPVLARKLDIRVQHDRESLEFRQGFKHFFLQLTVTLITGPNTASAHGNWQTDHPRPDLKFQVLSKTQQIEIAMVGDQDDVLMDVVFLAARIDLLEKFQEIYVTFVLFNNPV
ncbi:MAG TPA: hypothetical protein VIM51_04725 [Desulfosporosinus sp.]